MRPSTSALPATPATLAALALAALAMSPGSGRAQAAPTDLPTVAVLDFTGFMLGQAGNSVNLGKAVAAMLVTEFSERDGMHVIERARLQSLLDEQRLALSGRVDESSAVEVGRILGAQYVLHGQVSSVADDLRLDIRAVDVETSEVVAVLKKTDRTSELLAVVLWVADEFGGRLALTPPSERPSMEPIPVQATLEFSRAVSYEDEGDAVRALEHYRAALALHPAHAGARRAVARLQGGGA